MEKIRKCIVCSIPLNSEIVYPSQWKTKNYICKECMRQRSRSYSKEKYISDSEYRKKQNNRVKTWVSKNREHFNTYLRSYMRQHYVTYGDGRRVKVKKRSRPDNCELCNRKFQENEKACWHHWDDVHPEFGLYVCYHCHLFVEAIDHLEYEKLLKLLKNYLILKNQIPKFNPEKQLEKSFITHLNI